MSIVVTGFGPFSDVAENPSSSVVQELERLWRSNNVLDSAVSLSVITDIPVAYTAVENCVESIWKSRPDLVIHVGVALSYDAISLEQDSYNDGYCMLDVTGQDCGSDNCCIQNGPPKLTTKMELSTVCDLLLSAEIPACVSHSPGRFLCGYIYYLSLYHDEQRALFVHIPGISERWTKERLVEALYCIVSSSGRQRGLPIPDVPLFAAKCNPV